jgi:FAD:protein FMN transferase
MLELTLIGSAERAEEACAAVLGEVERLERVFSRFLPHSDLRRWLRREPVAASSELFPLLHAARRWSDATGGAFHPGAQACARLWSDGERYGSPPDAAALERCAAALGRFPECGSPPPYEIALDAIAKGRIVDALVDVAAAGFDLDGGLVNVGGDLRAWGTCEAVVAVADPDSSADNAATVATVHLRDAALATSGVRRRGYRIAGRWYPHLIDPRSGQPVARTAGATVVAATCAEADALATACCVLEPSEALELAAGLPGVGVAIWSRDGSVVANEPFLARAPDGVRRPPRGPDHGRP